ncbi:GvpL/GvpF family gas vesicle protein [Streptomyces fragilis]|uniref:GvpL/GvpF family gas vesicle protein n=1 Tax=Streptomyces fragilis TaxID=67301 RepID=A0ABV2YLL2_9ACTN|nr:GvpL/GvpF family gas vesicle protein [Streptomyces fragilis]
MATTASTVPSGGAPAAPPAAGGSLYVYGIAAAGVRAPRSRGVDGAAVRLLTSGSLSAAVSSAPAAIRARRRHLAAHQSVLDELARQGPVLPMRFAVLAHDEETLLSYLRDQRPRFEEQLERIRGCVEMNVKGHTVPGCFEDLVLRDEGLRELARRTRRRPDYDANVRLGEALARAVTREARLAAREVLDRLTPLARRTARGEVDDTVVLSASFLVPAEAEQRFRRAVEEQARRQGPRLALSLTGPLPCYSFVDAPITTGPAAGRARPAGAGPTRLTRSAGSARPAGSVRSASSVGSTRPAAGTGTRG